MTEPVPPSSAADPSQAGWLRGLPQRDWSDYEKPGQSSLAFFIKYSVTVSAGGVVGNWLLRFIGGGNIILLVLCASAAVLFGLLAVGAFVVACVRRRSTRQSRWAMLVWLIVCLILPQSLPDPFLLGFKHRIFGRMSTDQLRVVAARTSELAVQLQPKFGLFTNMQFPEPLQTALAGVGEGVLAGADCVYVEEGIVTFYWDDWGWDTRDWGVRVTPGGVQRRSGDAEYLQIEPDIALYLRWHNEPEEDH